MAWHLAQGHRVFLVSGTLEPIARAVARRLPGRVEVSATALEARDGCWTGRIAGAHMSGEAKGRAVRNMAARFGLALWESYAYGNSITDLPMLDAVGRRVAVNPRAGLRRIARRENWNFCAWDEPAVQLLSRASTVPPSSRNERASSCLGGRAFRPDKTDRRGAPNLCADSPAACIPERDPSVRSQTQISPVRALQHFSEEVR
jgi:hypothetical protein